MYTDHTHWGSTFSR